MVFLFSFFSFSPLCCGSWSSGLAFRRRNCGARELELDLGERERESVCVCVCVCVCLCVCCALPVGVAACCIRGGCMKGW